MKSKHFVTGSFQSHAKFLSEEVYAQVLDSIVVACVDCVVTRQGRVLLGKRVVEPQPDWWIIGGRMRPGESFEEAAQRNLKRELALSVGNLQRFQYLCTHSYVWGRRAQEPQENGCHIVGVTLTVELFDAEFDSLTFNEEYSEIQWLTPTAIFAQEAHFHPAVVNAVREYTVLCSL